PRRTPRGQSGRTTPPLCRTALARVVVDAEPGTGTPAGLVGGVEPLGDDSGQAVSTAGVRRVPSATCEVRWRLPIRSAQPKAVERFPALRVASVHSGRSVQPQQVIGEVLYGGVGGAAPTGS